MFLALGLWILVGVDTGWNCLFLERGQPFCILSFPYFFPREINAFVQLFRYVLHDISSLNIILGPCLKIKKNSMSREIMRKLTSVLDLGFTQERYMFGDFSCF